MRRRSSTVAHTLHSESKSVGRLLLVHVELLSKYDDDERDDGLYSVV